MADFFLSCVPIIVEHTIGPVKRHVGYVLNYKSNLENLDEQVELLRSAHVRVQHQVDGDRRTARLIEEDVEGWLQEVDGTIEKLREELIQAQENVKKRCFFALCPNLKIRYQLSKKALKEATAVVSLQTKGQFSTISHTAPLQWRGTMSIGDFEAFCSRMSVLKEIMNALTSVDVNMIGVCGIGGVGKTTLVKEVARQAKEDKLSDEVVFATVTNDVKVQNIQGQIADFLGLKFDVETVEGRAGQLCKRLKQEKKVLIILDDLWKELDLEAVGIPSKDDRKGCKLVLTSRDLKVLHGMGSQENFTIGALPDNEAWDLFKKMADDNLDDPDLLSTAKEVAKVCAGLPIAIVTVARALKTKSLSEWNNALLELRARNFTEMQEAVYSKIEFSYKYLEGVELQSTFLLCGQMGYNATTGDLLKYGIGLGLFCDVSTVEQAHNKVHTLVHKLKASCLLLDGNTSKQLAMHDVVRDVAVSITSREPYYALILDDENKLKEWVDEDKPKNYKAIWLRCNINKLPEEMQCPKLVLFHIDNVDPDLEVPASLFKGLHELKVLNLNGFYFSSLPTSLGSLKNLKTLCLHQSVFGNIGLVGELKKLEILSFAKSDIRYLPKEIGQLANLRLFDLSDCSELEVVPSGVLSSLSRLEELYMGNSFSNWEIEGLNREGRNNASLFELKHLVGLTILDIHIRRAHNIPKDIFSDKLSKYKIFVGDWAKWDWDDEFETSKTLKLKLTTNIHMGHGVRPLLKKSEDLYLDGLKGVTNILYELDSDGFPKLRHLHLHDSPEIRYIIDAMEMVAFPKLESLFLQNLISLEKISHYKLKRQSFSKLRVVDVVECDRLTHLFSFMVAQGLSLLQKISVCWCGSMEEIVGERSDEVHASRFEATSMTEFPQLLSLSLSSLPNLKNFCSEANRRASKPLEAATPAGSGRTMVKDGVEAPMPLFNSQILLPSLRDLSLEQINNETLWHAQLPAIANSFQNLTNLHVARCRSLKYLFPSSLVEYLGQLRYLSLWDCVAIEEVIAEERTGEEHGMNEVFFPKLQSLQLSYLSKLTRFCQGSLIKCPLLKELTISSCFELKTFISGFACTNTTINNELEENSQNLLQPLFDEKVIFPLLAEIDISNVNKIDKLWHDQLAADSFCELRKLNIYGCEKLANIFPPFLLGKFQKLEVLKIEYCDLINKIFEVEASEISPLSSFHLRNLTLSNLSKMRHVWAKRSQLEAASFNELRKIDIDGCEKLANTLPPFFLKFQKLEVLKIHSCDSLEQIFEVEGSSAGEVSPSSSFQLRELVLSDLRGLKHIWSKDPQGILTFPNLHSVCVYRCLILKNVFPFSIARDLLKLEELVIEGGVEEIVAKGENNEEAPCFLFPKLTDFGLLYLSNLRGFYAGLHAWEMPRLKKLDVREFNMAKLFAAEIDNQAQLDVQTQQLLLQQMIFNLEELTLEGENVITSITWLHQFPSEFFSSLKCLSLLNFDDEGDGIPREIGKNRTRARALMSSRTLFKNLQN